MSEYLARKGYEVDCADAPATAEGLLSRNRYDVALIDLRLTGATNASGMELVRHTRRSAPSTKVIILSAYGSALNQVEARQLGVSAFLGKPKPLAEVASAIAEVLARSEGATAGADAAGRKVLVIGATDELASQTRPLLAHAGCECITARDLDALAELERARPLMVLIDCSTNEAGEQVVSLVESIRKRHDVPTVVVASADTSAELLESFWSAGADDCIYRPIRPGHIQARVAALTATPAPAPRLFTYRAPPTVLLACDDAKLRGRLGELLELSGYHLLYAPLDDREVQSARGERANVDLLIALGERQDLTRLQRAANPTRPPLGLSSGAGGKVVLDGAEVPVETVVGKVNALFNRTAQQLQVEGRVPFFCPVEFRDVGENPPNWMSSYSFNISPLGIFLKTLAPVRPGAALELKIHLTTAREVLEGTGVVAWANSYAQRKALSYPVGMGVQFLGMSPKRLAQLREICRLAAGT